MITIDIEALNKVLFALLGSRELVNKWWVSKNKAFDMKTPRDAYIDDPHKVAKYIVNQVDPGAS